MLDLETTDKNEMTITDERMGTLTLIYSDPPPRDYLKIKGVIVKKAVSKVPTEDILEYQILESMKYLTGVPDGELLFAGKPVSTDPKSKLYNKDWKELLYKKAYKFLQKYSESLLGDYSTYVVKENPNFLASTGNSLNSSAKRKKKTS